ncbi:hypothetical protein K2173_005612 [Erythroxylum novogranatense]|uniref:TRAF-type domain-containing protein n=1 Tax=Erythroxylum novogranatense TaxID=1862640 RepID=A0AAV8SQ97_9ROSI|nr:hypothetical protein K2173_005612 [Erythroxylum novogranatense]
MVKRGVVFVPIWWNFLLSGITIGNSDLPQASLAMDPPLTDVELEPEGGLTFHCDLYDTELVHKIAQAFLLGLATACVDNTTGGIFKSPGSVAVDIRKEMIDYATQRSESFVAESVMQEGSPEMEVSDHPFDIISDFVDDFASSKRNFFSRVSGWLLSEKREDKVDDFVQEMEINGFWLLVRREALAQTLVTNVDFKNTFHCDKKFNTSEELVEHVASCGFRPLNCTNEGCTAIFCASQKEKHDSLCPFKIIPCEQKCPDSLMRREMDRHCITLCPMKLVNCPFYAVGCQSTVPKCLIQQHNSDDLHSHVLYILKNNYYKEAPVEALKQRADQILQASSGELGEARDLRTLNLRVKNLDAKLGPLEVSLARANREESIEAAENTNGEPTMVASNKDGDSTKAAKNTNKESIETENITNKGPIEAANISNEEPTEAANNTNNELTETAKEDGEPTKAATTKIEESAEAENAKDGEPTEVSKEKVAEAVDGKHGDPSEAENEKHGDLTEVIKKKDGEPTEAANRKDGEPAEEENEDPTEAANERGGEPTDAANERNREPINAEEVKNGEPTELANDRNGEPTEAANEEDGESVENKSEKNGEPIVAANNSDEEADETANDTKANKS